MKRLLGRPNLRIAVVTPFLDRQHGTELCIVEQIERLAFRDNWKIHLYSQRVADVSRVVPADSSAPDSQGQILWHKMRSIPGPHLFRYLWWFVANQVHRRFEWRSGRQRPDLVYSPGINCLDADVIAVHIVFHEFCLRVVPELKLRRIPIRRWPRVIHRRLYYKLAMILEKKVYSDHNVRLIAVSNKVANQLQDHFHRADVTVIPNAVDTDRFFPARRLARRPASRQSLHLSESEFVLLLIGNDWKKKGLDTLLEALALLSDLPLKLVVVGSDNPSIYRSTIESLNLENSIIFKNIEADVLGFYAAADLYVGPSLEDAFNLPILEAMACGLPTIASIEAGVSDNIRDYETGLLLSDPKDPIQLAGLIRRIFDDEPLRRKLSDAGSQHVQENCSWEQNASQTKQFLEIALNRLKGDT